jgi:hypothetical protein
MLMSPVGFRPEKDCAGDAQQKLQTRLLVREGAPYRQIRNCLEIIKEKMRKIDRGSYMGA